MVGKIRISRQKKRDLSDSDNGKGSMSLPLFKKCENTCSKKILFDTQNTHYGIKKSKSIFDQKLGFLK